ncbi:unnamed protein product, partial [Effrenium voratum]
PGRRVGIVLEDDAADAVAPLAAKKEMDVAVQPRQKRKCEENAPEKALAARIRLKAERIGDEVAKEGTLAAHGAALAWAVLRPGHARRRQVPVRRKVEDKGDVPRKMLRRRIPDRQRGQLALEGEDPALASKGAELLRGMLGVGAGAEATAAALAEAGARS